HQSRAHQFQRHTPARALLLRLVHAPHRPLADQAHHAVPPDLLGRGLRLDRSAHLAQHRAADAPQRLAVQDSPGRRPVGGQERLDLSPQRPVPAARLGQVRRALRRPKTPGLQKDSPHALVIHPAHVQPPRPDSSRASHARAIAQSSSTVESDTPSTRAASAIVRPPKNRSSTTRAARASISLIRFSASSNSRSWVASASPAAIASSSVTRSHTRPPPAYAPAPPRLAALCPRA